MCFKVVAPQATHKMKEQMDEGDTTSVVGVAGGRPNGSKEMGEMGWNGMGWALETVGHLCGGFNSHGDIPTKRGWFIFMDNLPSGYD